MCLSLYLDRNKANMVNVNNWQISVRGIYMGVHYTVLSIFLKFEIFQNKKLKGKKSGHHLHAKPRINLALETPFINLDK